MLVFLRLSRKKNQICDQRTKVPYNPGPPHPEACSALLTRVSPQASGEEVTGEQLHEILKEIDTNMNGQVELDEYLQVYIGSILNFMRMAGFNFGTCTKLLTDPQVD